MERGWEREEVDNGKGGGEGVRVSGEGEGVSGEGEESVRSGDGN